DQVANVGENQVDARQVVARERDAEIDREPLARVLAPQPVDREVHADLADAAQRREDELVGGSGHGSAQSRSRRSEPRALYPPSPEGGGSRAQRAGWGGRGCRERRHPTPTPS